MWGIYRGRRLVLYVIAAIVIATLIGYSTYTFVKLFPDKDVYLHNAILI